MIKTVEVQCTGSYFFSYDPESKKFREALKAYKKLIDKGGDESSMLCHVAHNLRRSESADSMVEGVGYLRKESHKKNIEPFSGITVDDDDPDYDYEIV